MVLSFRGIPGRRFLFLCWCFALLSLTPLANIRLRWTEFFVGGNTCNARYLCLCNSLEVYEGKCKLNCISGDGNTDNEHTEPKVIPCNSLRLDVAEVKIIAWDETLPMASRNDSRRHDVEYLRSILGVV